MRTLRSLCVLCASAVYVLLLPRRRRERRDYAYSASSYGLIDLPIETATARDRLPLPKVNSTKGPAAILFQIVAAMGVEFRLLRAERGLIVLVPLAMLLSFLSVPFSKIAVEVSYSVTSATNTANMLLLLLACVIVFYTGEVMHRDRELKIEPVIWSTPAPNSVLLLSKWLAMTLLALSVVMVGGLTTLLAQLFRGHTPIDVSAYLIINSVGFTRSLPLPVLTRSKRDAYF